MSELYEGDCAVCACKLDQDIGCAVSCYVRFCSAGALPSVLKSNFVAMPVHIGSNPTEEVIDLDEILGRDSADEEWDLRCGEQHDLALLSTKQLMYSLKAHVRQTKKLSGEWVAMKIEAANAKKQLDDERKGFEEVKSKLMADLAEANKTAESAQIREEMRAQSLLPPAPLPLKATVLFHDCIGRHYKIPFEKCNRWRVTQPPLCSKSKPR